MIQSGKFDSPNMDIKKLANSVLFFTINRLIEIFSILISILGLLLLIALVSYSPSDPNFVFPENTEISNVLGFQGSYVSDLFFQSLGFISYLIPFTYIFAGINVFKSKKILLLIENTFFIVFYSLIGSVFFNFYYHETFYLYINGGGGFVGNYFNETFFNNIISSYQNIFYYLFLLSIIIFFFIKY